MSSNLFSGHGSNLFSLKSLISSIIGYGAAYNPSKDTIKIDALQTKLVEGDNAVLAVNKMHPDFKNAVSDRDLAFRSLSSRITRVMNAFKVIEPNTLVRAHLRSLVRLIQGTPLKNKKKSELSGPPAAKENSANDITAHTMGYEARLANFDKMIQFLSSIPAYTPNEIELTVQGLTDLYNDLKAKNQTIVNTHLQLKNARIARNNVLYAQVTGLVHVGLDAKSYIKSVFGVKSPQYLQVAKLKFTIYKN
jgi:hypothetical protein